MKTLPIEKLRELLDYDPETGVLTWRVARNGSVRPGTPAGTQQKSGYIRIGICRQHMQAHRVAYAHFHGYWPEVDIDHRNRVRNDNSIVNLREGPGEIQNRNRVDLTSQHRVRGVAYHPRNSKRPYEAYICTKRKRTYLGAFATREEAAAAYDAAVLAQYGDTLPTNKSLGLI